MEYVETFGGWKKGRTYMWAGCVQKGAPPCGHSWTGAGWDSSVAASCAGDSWKTCSFAPTPLYTAPAHVRAASPTGFLETRPCPQGETCNEPLPQGGAQLPKCFPKNSSTCSAPQSSCSGTKLETCDTGYGIVVATDCAAQGKVCQPGCAGSKAAKCAAPSAKTCDPKTAPWPTSCDTAKSYTYCSGHCLWETEDCSQVISSNGYVPGKCVSSGGGAKCVKASEQTCDPATFKESCQGSVARRCDGLVRSQDCSKLGLFCGVNQGKAGCRPATATSCPPPSAVSCDGKVLQGCCPATGVAANGIGKPEYYCVPGFGYRIDCAKLKFLNDCDDQLGTPHCTWKP